MPSAKILADKQAQAAELTTKVSEAASTVIVNYFKTTVEDDTALRAQMRKEGVEYSVVKNTMLRFVFNATGYSELNDKLEGMTAIAICKDDAIAPSRILSKFAADHENYELKGGVVEGKVCAPDELTAIGKLGTKNDLIATVLGTFNAPIGALARVLQAVVDQKNEGASAEA